MYKIVYTKTAAKDASKLRAVHLTEKAKALIEILRVDPYQTPPPYEKLTGDLLGAYSRRLNIQHRLVYQVCEEEQTVKILSLWTHYERSFPQQAGCAEQKEADEDCEKRIKYETPGQADENA